MDTIKILSWLLILCFAIICWLIAKWQRAAQRESDQRTINASMQASLERERREFQKALKREDSPFPMFVMRPCNSAHHRELTDKIARQRKANAKLQQQYEGNKKALMKRLAEERADSPLGKLTVIDRAERERKSRTPVHPKAADPEPVREAKPVLKSSDFIDPPMSGSEAEVVALQKEFRDALSVWSRDVKDNRASSLVMAEVAQRFYGRRTEAAR